MKRFLRSWSGLVGRTLVVSVMVASFGAVLLGGVAVMPAYVHADTGSCQDSGLVTCGCKIKIDQSGGGFTYTNECSVCDLQRLGMKLLTFFVMIFVAIAALLFVNAGYLYLTASAKPANVARAHKVFVNTMIGLVVVLAAYMLIDVIVKSLVSQDASNKASWGPWNEILCSGVTDSYTIDKVSQITISAGAGVTPVHTVQELQNWSQNQSSRDSLAAGITSTIAVAQKDPTNAALVPKLQTLLNQVNAVDPYSSDAATKLSALWSQYQTLLNEMVGPNGTTNVHTASEAAGYQNSLLAELTSAAKLVQGSPSGSDGYNLAVRIASLKDRISSVDTTSPNAYDILAGFQSQVDTMVEQAQLISGKQVDTSGWGNNTYGGSFGGPTVDSGAGSVTGSGSGSGSGTGSGGGDAAAQLQQQLLTTLASASASLGTYTIADPQYDLATQISDLTAQIQAVDFNSSNALQTLQAYQAQVNTLVVNVQDVTGKSISGTAPSTETTQLYSSLLATVNTWLRNINQYPVDLNEWLFTFTTLRDKILNVDQTSGDALSTLRSLSNELDADVAAAQQDLNTKDEPEWQAVKSLADSSIAAIDTMLGSWPTTSCTDTRTTVVNYRQQISNWTQSTTPQEATNMINTTNSIIKQISGTCGYTYNG